jgi:hypothetical protein
MTTRGEEEGPKEPGVLRSLFPGASSWTASDPDQTFALHVGPARNVVSPKVLWFIR